MSGMVRVDRSQPIISGLFAGMPEVRCDEFIRRLRLNMGVHESEIRIVPRSEGPRDPWEKVEFVAEDAEAKKAGERARLARLQATMDGLDERIAKASGSEFDEQLFEQYRVAEEAMEAELERQWDDGVQEREDAEARAAERKWEEEQKEKDRLAAEARKKGGAAGDP
jgi:hypothetical protein